MRAVNTPSTYFNLEDGFLCWAMGTSATCYWFLVCNTVAELVAHPGVILNKSHENFTRTQSEAEITLGN